VSSSAPPSDRPTSTILVVEDRAHDADGHAPIRFAELAAALANRGAGVEVLTARGWCRAGASDLGLPIHCYTAPARRLHEAVAPWRRPDHPVARAERLVVRLVRAPGRDAAWRRIRSLRQLVRGALLVVEVRRRLREMADATAVVVVADTGTPRLLSLLAGNERWLLYLFAAPPPGRIGRVASAWRERAREARGGRFVLAAPSARLCATWRAAQSMPITVTAPLAGVAPEPAVPGARDALGLPAATRIALLFGASYDDKDPGIVLDAVAELQGWELVLAGSIAGKLPDRPGVRRFPGYVDDATRARLFTSADVVVLSFVPGFARNSGTLMNAVAWGVPVVCSDDCAPADLVRAHRLGNLFTAGDARSLADAIENTVALDPLDLARARTALSNDRVAARALALLGGRRGVAAPARPRPAAALRVGTPAVARVPSYGRPTPAREEIE
jgi:glycosyltransferase involved in cell wall biosynthesis